MNQLAHSRANSIQSDIACQPTHIEGQRPTGAYLIRDRLGAEPELLFARSLASRKLPAEEMLPSDRKSAAELFHAHPVLGLIDATVCAVAERLKLEVIATTGRRDFSRVRPKQVKSFALVP